MKKITVEIIVAIALLAVLGVASCSRTTTVGTRDPNVDYYTCTMHPSVHSRDPGKCPICSMDLVPVMKRTAPALAAAANQPNEFIVPVERQQQIGVTYARGRAQAPSPHHPRCGHGR